MPLLDTYQAVVSAYSEFLTVAIHTILYERNIYPRTSFISARKYNFPVRQNRHPKVCKWIQDAVSAVEIEMLKVDRHQGAVSQTSLIIYSATSQPLERFVFSTASFPTVPTSEALTPFETVTPPVNPDIVPPTTDLDSTSATTARKPPTVPLIDLEEQFRAIFARLSTCNRTLMPLPPNCSFTIAIELKDKVDPPIGHPQPWIAAQPGLQPKDSSAGKVSTDGDENSSAENGDEARRESGRGKDLGGVRTTPVRSVEAGEFVMEMWIEEGKGKEDSIVEIGGTDQS
ncbi:hypothetical protein MMC24_004712 [Lignoscripta atroalba]|nr:hypothetical protein [Lignoscripta atroalba]